MGTVGVAAVCAWSAGQVAHAQNEDRVAWLRDHAVRVKTIDPAVEAFEDLTAFGEAIGEARVVMLGEATHGDGAASLAKSRIVKYLHQRKGFDVLAFEAGFHDGLVAGEGLSTDPSARERLVKALNLWSGTREFQPLLDYTLSTQRSERPIAPAGIGWYTHADSALFFNIIAFFEAVDANLPPPEERQALDRIESFLEKLDTFRRPPASVRPPESDQLDAMISRCARDPGGRLRDHHGPRTLGFMIRSLENLRAFLDYWHKPQPTGGAEDNPVGVEEGKNILFLANDYFPGRKMIVWAHNGHIARASSGVEEPRRRFKFAETITTGHRVYQSLRQDMYAVMVISHSGRTSGGGSEPRTLPAPPPNSLEQLMHQAGLSVAFFDLRRLPAGHWLRERNVAWPVAYAPMRADWGRVFDGILFVDTMSPTTDMPDDP